MTPTAIGLRSTASNWQSSYCALAGSLKGGRYIPSALVRHCGGIGGCLLGYGELMPSSAERGEGIREYLAARAEDIAHINASADVPVETAVSMNVRPTVRQCDAGAGLLAFVALCIALAPGALPFEGRGPIFLCALSLVGLIRNGRKAARNKDIIRVVRITKGQVALSAALLFAGAVVCTATMVAISNFWGPFGLFLALTGLVIQLLVKRDLPARSTP